MQRQLPKENQKKLVTFLKEFVNKTLIKHFRDSDETMTEWNYFSSLISQQYIDYEKIRMYLDRMTSDNNQSPSPNKNLTKIIKSTSEEEKKTNSGIYGKKQQQANESDRYDFQLNKTVGGNADRIKFTGMMFPTKTNPYTFETKDKKKLSRQTSGGGINHLIQNMNSLCNSMQDNQTRLQNNIGRSNVNGVGNSFGVSPQPIGSNFYKWRPDQRNI